jgi:hypothetical protein
VRERSREMNRFIDSFTLVPFHQDVAAYIKKEFDKKHNPTW